MSGKFHCCCLFVSTDSFLHKERLKLNTFCIKKEPFIMNIITKIDLSINLLLFNLCTTHPSSKNFYVRLMKTYKMFRCTKKNNTFTIINICTIIFWLFFLLILYHRVIISPSSSETLLLMDDCTNANKIETKNYRNCKRTINRLQRTSL